MPIAPVRSCYVLQMKKCTLIKINNSVVNANFIRNFVNARDFSPILDVCWCQIAVYYFDMCYTCRCTCLQCAPPLVMFMEPRKHSLYAETKTEFLQRRKFLFSTYPRDIFHFIVICPKYWSSIAEIMNGKIF